MNTLKQLVPHQPGHPRGVERSDAVCPETGAGAGRSTPRPVYRSRQLLGYLLAVVLTSGTLWARHAIGDRSGERLMLIVFMLPILVSARVGGLGPGLVATALASLGAAYVVIPPAGSPVFATSGHLVQWLLLLVVGGVGSCLCRSVLAEEATAAEDGGRTERKVRWGFALALVVLVLTGGLAQMSVGWMTRETREATDTVRLISQLNRILLLSIDAETAQRGYVITGDSRYLEPYEDVMARVETEIASLREVARSHPERQSDIEELVGIVRERLAEAGRTIELRRTVGLGSSVDQIVGGGGRELQERIRSAVDQLQEAENTAFRRNAASSAASARTTTQVLLGTSVVAISLAAVGLYLVGLDFAGARRAERQLREAHALLERRVAERTAELAGANRELQAGERRYRELNTDLEKRVAERTAQWETANKELEAFSYSVSHDLRAPLRTVDGFAQALAEDYGARLPPEGLELIRTIRGGAGRMAQLIDDLLTFSRLSRAPMRRDTIDTADLVRGVLESLEGGHAGHEVEVQVGALPPCEGDPALLRQVWLNLLANAFKYTGRRAQAVIAVGAESSAAGPVFYVKDNGAGFDMKYAHKLFGVFQRLHRSEDYEGTGVGLAIVHRIVTRHGGRVWAEAAPDRGATFFFTLGIPTES